MNIRACKGCRYFTKYYGSRGKNGEPIISRYWCVSKQGFIRSFPKQCNLKKESEGGR